jgi:hypothetical protein
MKQNFTVRQGVLDGVEAFPSVALRRSFRRATAERGVTPSAISQAVRTLETRVGTAPSSARHAVSADAEIAQARRCRRFSMTCWKRRVERWSSE